MPGTPSVGQGFHPGAVATLLGGVTTPLVEHLLASSRFAARLEAVLHRRLPPRAEPVTPTQAALLAMGEGALDRVALRAGAAWHGRAMVRAVDGVSVRAVIAAIGPELRAAGLAHAALRPEDGGALPPPNELATAVARDGYACLRAWCYAQPGSAGQEVWLRLPPRPETGAEAGFAADGPALVTAVVLATAETAP